jgi:hypothetical protein
MHVTKIGNRYKKRKMDVGGDLGKDLVPDWVELVGVSYEFEDLEILRDFYDCDTCEVAEPEMVGMGEEFKGPVGVPVHPKDLEEVRPFLPEGVVGMWAYFVDALDAYEYGLYKYERTCLG